MLVGGCGGRSAHVAAEELAAARADAVEDRRVPNALHLEIPADAYENFFFVHPCLFLVGPVVALRLP